MITYDCAACGTRHELPDRDAGTRHRCNCGNVNVVPEAPPAEPPAPAEPRHKTSTTPQTHLSLSIETPSFLMGEGLLENCPLPNDLTIIHDRVPAARISALADCK